MCFFSSAIICSSWLRGSRVGDQGSQDFIKRDGIVFETDKGADHFFGGVDGLKIDLLKGKGLAVDHILRQGAAHFRYDMVVLALGQSVF